MPDWVGPLLALAAILAFLYFAFVKTKRAYLSGRRDEDRNDYTVALRKFVVVPAKAGRLNDN